MEKMIMMNEMEKLLHDNSEKEYYKIIKQFGFGDKQYKAPVQFAYLNSSLDTVFKSHDIKFDRTWMWDKALTYGTYKKYMDQIVEKLYQQKVSITKSQEIMMEIVNIINKIVYLLNSGKKVSLDFNLLNILQEAIRNPELDRLLRDEIDPNWTPEKIYQHRNEMKQAFKKVYAPGITELMTAGEGIKADQMVNIFGGIHLVPRIHNMEEIFPLAVPVKWLDGIKTKEQFFVVVSINTYAMYMNRTVIRRGGVINKEASMVAQEATIVEDDCGSINYESYYVSEDPKIGIQDLKNILRKYRVLEDGSLKEVTLDDYEELKGTYVKVRSVLKCACKSGICATCFGAHAFWNKSTTKYRKDLGVELCKDVISKYSQLILSTKHNTAPQLIASKFFLTNTATGEMFDLEDDNTFYTREFNRLKFKPGVTVSFLREHCINPLREKKKTYDNIDGDIKPIDQEFGNMEIIRVDELILNYENQDYLLTANTDFRISGFPKFKKFVGEEIVTLDPKVNEVSHVIRNDGVAKKFYAIEDLYKTESRKGPVLGKNEVDTLEEFLDRVGEVIPDVHKSIIEILFRNKVRSKEDPKNRPDWTKPNPEYIIETTQNAITSIPSLSLKISQGYIKKRLNDVTYHDPSNLVNTVYDRLYFDLENYQVSEDNDEYYTDVE